MAVDDWFLDFYLDHTAGRHKRDDWPDLDSHEGKVFYDGFRHLLVVRGVHDRDVAEEASVAMMGAKLWNVSDHPAALVAAAALIYQARGANGQGASLDDRESAALASRACTYCDGIGMAVVWASRPDPARKIAETSSAYCICALGRWAERTHREKSPDLRKRIPDLADVLNGRSFWRLNPPGMAPVDASRGVRMVPPPAPPADAVRASADCPECKGTGWAKRRAAWHSLVRPFVVELGCRCPLGAWRIGQDDGMRDALQSNPDVWDSRLSHRTWSKRPSPSPLIPDPDSDGKWRYLHPDEPAPAPMANLRDVAGQTARDLAPGASDRPRPEWMRVREEFAEPAPAHDEGSMA
jgi:hypothetical protein